LLNKSALLLIKQLVQNHVAPAVRMYENKVHCTLSRNFYESLLYFGKTILYFHWKPKTTPEFKNKFQTIQ